MILAEGRLRRTKIHKSSRVCSTVIADADPDKRKLVRTGDNRMEQHLIEEHVGGLSEVQLQ